MQQISFLLGIEGQLQDNPNVWAAASDIEVIGVVNGKKNYRVGFLKVERRDGKTEVTPTISPCEDSLWDRPDFEPLQLAPISTSASCTAIAVRNAAAQLTGYFYQVQPYLIQPAKL